MSAHAQPEPYKDEVADYLRYSGHDWERAVRRFFQRRGIPLLRRDRGTFLDSNQQLAALVEAEKCSPSGEEAESSRSASVARPAGSKCKAVKLVRSAARRRTCLR